MRFTLLLTTLFLYTTASHSMAPNKQTTGHSQPNITFYDTLKDALNKRDEAVVKSLLSQWHPKLNEQPEENNVAQFTECYNKAIAIKNDAFLKPFIDKMVQFAGLYY